MGASIVNMAVTKQFLSLVRAALWQIPPDRKPFDEAGADWDAIGRLSVQQTVGPLMMSGAMSLPSDLLPPREWLHKAHAFIERNRRTHVLLDSCVAEAAAGLRAAGIEPVLLKGQAYARHYPDPKSRQCGDIDLYVGEEHYHAAYDAACRLGWACDERFFPQAKHYGCAHKGVRIELHRSAAELDGRSANREFREWSLGHIHAQRCKLEISGGEINLPSPMFDVVYGFIHLYRHFIISGVGLRQVCDWVMLLHAHSKRLDVADLKSVLCRFGMLRGWRLFAPVAVEYLGLPEDECPFYSESYSGRAAKILSFILSEGNFGKYAPVGTMRPEGYLAGKSHSFRHQTIKLMSRVSLDPVMVMNHYRKFLTEGVKVVAADILKRR